MNTQKQKIASVGILLGITVIIGLGTASYQLFSQPNNAEAEQLEETTDSTLFKETTQTSEKMTEQSSTVESSVSEEEVNEQTETSASMEEQPVEQAQVMTEEPSVQQEQTAVEEVQTTTQEQATVQEAPAMTITMLGRTINYQNGGSATGQSIIDSDPNGTVSTWGGSTVQSGNDGLNTHFIGHNPGVFDVIFSLTGGDNITITDSAGATTVYTVRTIMTVDDNGSEVGTAIDYYELITGTGGGERVTFQSCITDTTNLIVIAYS